MTTQTIFILTMVLVFASAKLSDEDWMSIPMPSTSYFIGFPPPTNKLKWQLAVENAKSGKQLLLEKVIQQVEYPGEIISGDIHFGWIFRLCDSFVKSISDFAKIPDSEAIGFRTPITLIGDSKFESSDYEGRAFAHQSLGPNQIVKAITHDNFKLPKKMIGIGLMNENWGWLSTHYLNRTATWGFGLTEDLRYSHESSNEQIKPFLDDPNLVMILVNQHHNVSVILYSY